MAKIRGVDLDIDLVNGELRIELPDGHCLGFAARTDIGDVIIALERHYGQHGGMAHGGRRIGPLGHVSIGVANMPPDAIDAAVDHAVKRITGSTSPPHPTPCWHCGYTDGHAPSCKAVPRS